MIFQSLIALYDRLVQSNTMPSYGFSVEDIGFVITIDTGGNLVGEPEDLRTKIKANTFEFRTSVVPYANQVNVRSGNAATTPNFIIDKADYIFGLSGKTSKSLYQESFAARINEVCGDSTDRGILAVKAFLQKWVPETSAQLNEWKEISGDRGAWIAFRLEGDRGFVHERPAIKQLWAEFVSKGKFMRGVNFVDGLKADLQTQYAQFKFGSGASLVSFNEVAYESYGKKKGENAPISVDDEFKSASALKHLLRSRTQRLRIGDATTLFWAEKTTPIETFFGQVLNPSISDQEAAVPVRTFLESLRGGNMPNEIKDDGAIKFYILGLSLNKARLSIRFWFACTVKELIDRLRDHFSCLEMERSQRDIPFPGVWHLLRETARKSKDISPVLGGQVTRSILIGAHYPLTLYQAVLGRIRADQQINYLRASILKAVLTRNYNKEIPMSLDTERRETAYLLGRLFAVLEKAQLDALGKINTTIKDRFFSAASATPASVFPRLIQLSQHHIEKAEYGHVSDRRIAEIIEHINSFPPHMNLQEQGLFDIAYYQQKNALYRKSETTNQGDQQ